MYGQRGLGPDMGHVQSSKTAKWDEVFPSQNTVLNLDEILLGKNIPYMCIYVCSPRRQTLQKLAVI